MNTDKPSILPVLFSHSDFIDMQLDQFNDYVNMRVRGFHAHEAMRKAFGPENGDGNVQLRVDYLESTKRYVAAFHALMKVIPLDQILNERMAIHEFMSMYRSRLVKDSVRLAALDKATVLAGITVIDEAGRTVKRRSLADLYGEFEAKPEAGKPNAGLH